MRFLKRFQWQLIEGSMRKPLACSLILTMSALNAAGALAAGAQSNPGACSDGDAACLDTIQVTATKRPESTLEVPAATTIVGGPRLRETAPQTPMDALHGEPGTFVQQTTPGQGVVIVRGLKGSEVLHLVDGFRLNNAIFRNAPNQYIALVDGQSLERIEVVRGPSSTLYGGDAMGGVVQMLTPELRFDGDQWRWNGRLRAIASSADDAFTRRAELSGGREDMAFSLGVTAQDVDDLRIGGGRKLPQSGFSQRSGDFKWQARIAPGHELMFGLQYAEQPKTPRHDALVPGFGQTAPENAMFFFEPQQRRFAQLRWRIDTPNMFFDSAELRIGRQVMVDDRRTRAFATVLEERERNRDTTTGIAGQFGKDFGGEHHLSYGFEFYRDEVESSRARTNLTTGATTIRQPRFPNDSRMDGWALYAAHDWRRGRADLNYGLRYSRFDISIPAAAPAPGLDLSPDDFTGNLGFAFELAEDWRFVANLGRGFRAPNIFDLGVFGPRPGNRYSLPNADLKPEHVLSLDAGVKFGTERMSGEFIAFRSRYRDKITSVLTGDTIDGALVVQNRNVTRLDLWGVEAGGRYRLPSPDLELYATATYTRGDEEIDGGSMPADRIPPLYGKLGARWRPNARFDLEAYNFYAARQRRLSARDAIDPRIDPEGSAGWTTWNARLAWRASRRFDLALRVENIGDKNYREHGSGLDEPGRNFIVTADYHF
ncbi:MAG: TonB-dependent receptor [Lysobacteraceae bacterium]|nr:MAG: TonB-dependent receptor [Xanthomonadaceae bacterium]